MLTSLSIRNYAIIQELEIDFNKGLSTITGETGAGKSILLGALALILGNRADTTVLFDKAGKCIVEGSFSEIPVDIEEILNENEIDTDLPLLLRREIAANGKSRAFINDTPVNLQVMKETGLRLVDIHSQHQNLNLNRQLFQLNVIDAFAKISSEAEEYRKLYHQFVELKREYNHLSEAHKKDIADLDYLKFQFEELEEAKLEEDNIEEVEKELESLSHAEEIQNGLYAVWNHLNGEEINALSLIKNAESELQKISKFHKLSEELKKRIESAVIELKDISSEAELSAASIENDPKRLEYLKDRIDKIYSLQQKHRVDTLEELIRLKKDIEERILGFTLSEEKLEKLSKEISSLKAGLEKRADDLSNSRKKAFPSFENKITQLLTQLGMPNANFKVQHSILEEPGESGIDVINFLFSANKKAVLQELSKIASGGELSRLMLGIKYIISDSLGLPTLIFDEIDTGVSGEIAYKVAGMMKEMSANHQVFTITHLAQVASRGDHHYLVYKKDQNDRTITSINRLSEKDRLDEIARMLSGEQTTEAAIANARELLAAK